MNVDYSFKYTQSVGTVKPTQPGATAFTGGGATLFFTPGLEVPKIMTKQLSRRQMTHLLEPMVRIIRTEPLSDADAALLVAVHIEVHQKNSEEALMTRKGPTT